MRITGITPTAIVNVGIIVAVSAATFILKDGTPLLGLAFVQPLPVQVVAENSDELRASMGYPGDEQSSPIGFIRD